MPSKSKTTNLGSASFGCLLLLIGAVPAFLGQTFDPDGEPRKFAGRNAYGGLARYGDANNQHSHGVRKSVDTVPPTAPSNLRVSNPPIPLVQGVQAYINRTFLRTHTTASFDSSGGDLIVVCASSHAGVTLTPSDNFGNAWVSAAGPTNTSAGFNLRTQVWYAKNPTVGQGHTFTLTLSAPQSLVMSVVVVRGADISAPIDAVSAIGDDSGSQTLQVTSPNITTTNRNDLLIGFVKSSVAENFDPNSGFTAQPLASSPFLYAETRPAMAPGTYAATFSLNAAATWEAVVVSVSPSPVGASLSWTASRDNVAVAGYSVERCAGVGCRKFAQIATPAGTTFNDTGLAPTVTYRYRIRGRDEVGNLTNKQK